MTREFPSAVDVVIVGSGPTGAAYARILSELRPDLEMVTFEVGPQLGDPPGGHVKNIADDGRRARAQRLSEGPSEPVDDGRLWRAGTFLLPAEAAVQPGEDGMPSAAMSSNVGGMGAHWTAACPRPGGSERIEFLDNFDELLDDAERLLAVASDPFADAPLSGEVRRRLGAALDAGRTPDRTVRPMPLAVTVRPDGHLSWSGSDVVYGEATRRNPRHRVIDRALVRRVVVSDSVVRAVVVADLTTGVEHRVAATEVVVAADALRTPQLLWASGVRPAALGRYLNDQPQTIHAVRLAHAPHTEADGRSAGIAAHSGVSWVPFTDSEPFHGQVMQMDASPVPLAEGDDPEPGSVVGLGWFCAKDVQADDRVEFDDTAVDGYGQPAISVHYRLTDVDRARLGAAREAVIRAAAALGDALDPEPRVLPAGASLHYQGTVRMGVVDDGTSVCDPSSRVWGVQGLRVAGNGVIPTATACNPTLTSVALAVGGARALAATVPTRAADRVTA